MKTIPLARYVFERLRQANCNSLHGVPGDFTLRALDHVQIAGLKWINNANELCAGYAADGYARIKPRRSRGARSVGALMTTYGVGELSAINAVAGSYAESIPVVHIVGTPSRKAWRAHSKSRPLHHTLADGRMDVFALMAKHVTCHQADFHKTTDPVQSTGLFDEVLRQCVLQSKPVYVNFPCDLMELPVPAKLLERPIDYEPPTNNKTQQTSVVDAIMTKIKASNRPILIADALAKSFDFAEEANTLSRCLKLPLASFTAGKGVFDESSPQWLGTLCGPTEYASSADLVLMFGPILSDTNTAGWTAVPECKNVISFNLDSIEIDGRKYELRSKPVLQELVSQLPNLGERPIQNEAKKASPIQQRTGPITQDTFWSRVNSYIKPSDTCIFANGTPLIGSRGIALPPKTESIASPIWCSVGQMLPAAQGVALAKRDHRLPGRTLLFEGDGSFQMTCQSLSDIIRYKLDMTIFIINNGGYTYERWLNGMEAEYNDVPNWRYVDAARFFGGNLEDEVYRIVSRRVEDWSALEDVLISDRMHAPAGLEIIDVVMHARDVPEHSKVGLRAGSKALRYWDE